MNPVTVRRTRATLVAAPPMMSEPLQRPESTTRGTHAVVADLVLANCSYRKVLDIPCGYGAILERFTAAGIESHGADIRNTIARPTVGFRMADMDQPLPYDDEHFDAVTCIDGIEHIERPFDFIRECHRIIRPSGCLIITTPNISSLRSRTRWLLTGFHNKAKTVLDETAPHPRHHRSMVAFHELRYRLHSCGFSITDVRTNRIKLASWLYLPLAPIAYLATKLVHGREQLSAEEARLNQQVLKQMMSPAVLFGETLIVKAERL